ncbi:Efflux pump periplasmic linker BepF [Raoultella terrigena]|nr:Efflux pump periplasmic linker BepF [Raoultella terrigena]
MSLQKPWVNFHRRLLGTALLAALLAGCDNGVAQNAAPQAPAVSAADVVVKPVSQWDSFNGRIEAVESVQLRPRVSGYIDKVNYTDGQEVKKGEVLFTIDDRNLPRRARAGAGGALAQQNPGQPGAQRSRPYR